jgi:DHA3 family macrolide efflux protein-like MFS transporter
MSLEKQEQGTVRRVAYSSLLRNRSFVALWLGQTVSFIGDYFYWLAIPILVERLTGSTLMVGLSVISTAAPMLFLGPVAGVFVDRWDRRKTMLAADLLRATLVLLCLTVRSPDQVWVYYLVGFLMSCVSRFFFPAQNAVLPLLVKGEGELLAANGLMQIVQTVGLLVGPMLAGFTIGLWGESVAFWADSVTFLVSAAAILIMRVPHTTAGKQAAGGQVAAVWAELREGVAYLFGSQVMVGVLICLAVLQLGLGAINVLWVPFFQRTFGVGPEGLGAVDMAQGLGMVIGGVVLGLVTARIRRTTLVSWGIVIIGLLIALMGLAPAFSLVDISPALGAGSEGLSPEALSVGQRLLRLPLLLLGYSLMLGVVLVPAQSALMTIMQLAVPDLKRGRVGSALNAVVTVASWISLAAAAALGEVISLRLVYVIAGAFAVTSGLLGRATIREPDLPAEAAGELAAVAAGE